MRVCACAHGSNAKPTARKSARMEVILAVLVRRLCLGGKARLMHLIRASSVRARFSHCGYCQDLIISWFIGGETTLFGRCLPKCLVSKYLCIPAGLILFRIDG